MDTQKDLNSRIAVLGAGLAGLITGYVLRRDGFTNVAVYTRDALPGGVWSKERIYDGLVINSVHGQFAFSVLDMSPPSEAEKTGGRLSGLDVRVYLERFADLYMKEIITYQTEIVRVTSVPTDKWKLSLRDLRNGSEREEVFDKIVICTGGASEPYYSPNLSPDNAKSAGFAGIHLHSLDFGPRLSDILDYTAVEGRKVVVIGGGRSAQDISSMLAARGRKVTQIFEYSASFLASSSPLPDSIRKSRLLSVFAPHIDLRTRLERFLHTTSVGGAITRGFWAALDWSSLQPNVFKIPQESPLRKVERLLWSIHTNDEGNGRPDGKHYHALAVEGLINIVAPAHVVGYSQDGEGVMLADGRKIPADVVIIATGTSSSWDTLLDATAREAAGLTKHELPEDASLWKWNYTSMSNPPAAEPLGKVSYTPLYRGMIPTRNMDKRNIAINGAAFSTNPGLIFEISAHWISSYFRRDQLKLPPTPDAALRETEREAAWLKHRYPHAKKLYNESFSTLMYFWTWPQFADELLEDMGLRSYRDGGSWLTWIFKPVKLENMQTLQEDRAQLRVRG